MSKIHSERVMPLLVDKSSTIGQALLRDIVVLQSKLDIISNQDFYFQKGKEFHQQRLEKMKAEYAQIVETVNGNEVDFFLESIKEVELEMGQIDSMEIRLPLFAKAILKECSNSKIKQLRELIHIKGKFGTLKPLDDLIKDEATLIQIFEL